MDIYQQEIDELTSLMREEWHDVKRCVKRAGFNPETTLLAAFTEDEEEMEFSILVTEEKKIFECSRSTSKDAEIVFSSIVELPINESTFSLTPTIRLAMGFKNA